MTRYIDADVLLEKLQVDFDKQGRKSDDMALRGESELSVKYNHGQYCYLNAMEQVKDTPTADVVPKSEVEELSGKYEDLKLKYADLQKDKEELIAWGDDKKAEVAREIFEEIEKKVKASITVHLEELNKEHIQDTPLYDRHSGIIFALRVMDDFISELKKKYTEGNHD